MDCGFCTCLLASTHLESTSTFSDVSFDDGKNGPVATKRLSTSPMPIGLSPGLYPKVSIDQPLELQHPSGSTCSVARRQVVAAKAAHRSEEALPNEQHIRCQAVQSKQDTPAAPLRRSAMFLNEAGIDAGKLHCLKLRTRALQQHLRTWTGASSWVLLLESI
eukprot:scpid42793/ scgid11456/ 